MTHTDDQAFNIYQYQDIQKVLWCQQSLEIDIKKGKSKIGR